MNRSLAALAVLTLACVPALASAGTVTLTDWTANDNFKINAPGGGGAFKATINSGPLAGMNPFITFCLEFTEHFNLGGTYNYVLSDYAVNGGPGGTPPPGGLGDPVSDATKWLYYKAVTGGYIPLVNAAISAAGIAGDLTRSGSYIQEAIWFLENERLQAQISAISYQLAIAVNPASWAAVAAGGARVHAMNLTSTTDGSRKQDQLALVVPELGVLANLAAGLGMLGLGAPWLTRHRRRD